MLSGIEHFVFCRRRWGLIHIENQWADNFRTVDGSLMHQNAHDKGFRESRGDRFITRGMSVHSATLGISGQCDVVEFIRSSAGIPMPGRDGLWQPYPVEYKRGKPNERGAEELQLCAQALCLEEMLCCDIAEGALYHGETRHRSVISFTQELRRSVRAALAEMHELFARRHTPRVKPTKSCNACSLKDLCLPKLMGRKSVNEYLRQSMEEA